MAKEKIWCWRVTVCRPGYVNMTTVCPIAKDKLQASHRAANMLGLVWKENVRFMEVEGPIKAQTYQIRQWNEAYPEWSTEREKNPSSASLRSAPSPQGEGFGRGRRIATSASPPRNDTRGKALTGEKNPSTAPRSPSPAGRGGLKGGQVARATGWGDPAATKEG